MNRFYKVQPKQYVDTFTELPLQFMQGLAEGKQRGFDTALAGADASESLLNFNVIPGDTEHYKEKVGKYNDEISKVRDQLIQSGDYTQATRDLVGINRRLNKDQDLTVMKNQYEPWKKAVEERSKLDDYALRSGWQKGDDLMSATTFNKNTNSHNLLSFNHGYKAPDYNKDAGVFGDLKLSTNEFGRTFWDDGNGKKIEVTSQNDAITKDMIKQRALTSLPLYRDTPSYIDHLNEGRAYGLSGDQLIQFADAKGYENLVSKGMSQLQSVRKDVRREDSYNENDLKARGSVSGGLPNLKFTNSQFVPDTGMHLPEQGSLNENSYIQNNFIQTPNTVGGVAGAGTIVGTNTKIYKNPTNLPEEVKPAFTSYMIHTYGAGENSIGSKILKGKASQEELKQAYEGFSKQYNADRMALIANNKSAPITDAKGFHNENFGVDKAEITSYDIEKASGYNPDRPVYSVKDNKWTTLGEAIKDKTKGEKVLTVNANKVYNPYNSFVTSAKLEGNIPDAQKFSNSFAFTMGDDSYVTYGSKSDHEAEQLNSIYNAEYNPRTPQQFIVNKPNGTKETKYAVFVPDVNTDEYIQMRSSEQKVPGTYYIFDNKNDATYLKLGKASFKSSSFDKDKDPNGELYINTRDPLHIYDNIVNN